MKDYFKVDRLKVGYAKKTLIENINFSLEKGQILSLIGPNGAGKSTILKSIARELSVVKGTIYLDNKNLLQMSEKTLSKNMSVVLTERLKSEMMTCQDVVATGRYPYTGRFGILSEIDKRIVEESIKLVHVTEIKDKDFSLVSDGQRQRVMLARAICQEPEIIILDEPTSYLDVKYKLEFLSILQELKRKKRLTVIMSLHELELAERISDKILCIGKNGVDKFGSPEEIFSQGYIRELFSISKGIFDEENVSMELEAPKGIPKVFVIAGGGSGKNVYRALQRNNTAFISGILSKNDLDYPVAKALASQLIEVEAFHPIGEKELREAREKLIGCDKIISCKKNFAPLEYANLSLLEFAKDNNKKIEIIDTK